MGKKPKTPMGSDRVDQLRHDFITAALELAPELRDRLRSERQRPEPPDEKESRPLPPEVRRKLSLPPPLPLARARAIADEMHLTPENAAWAPELLSWWPDRPELASLSSPAPAFEFSFRAISPSDSPTKYRTKVTCAFRKELKSYLYGKPKLPGVSEGGYADSVLLKGSRETGAYKEPLRWLARRIVLDLPWVTALEAPDTASGQYRSRHERALRLARLIGLGC